MPPDHGVPSLERFWTPCGHLTDDTARETKNAIASFDYNIQRTLLVEAERQALQS